MADYRLKVTQVEQVCFFELTWGKGRQLTAKLPYPAKVEALYQSWQRIYLNYYQSALRSGLRGKAVISGQLTTKTDWHGQLVEAEAKLLYEFHQWLRSAMLFDIRSELGGKKAAEGLDLLITCDPIDLGRWPWEEWEISAEFGSTGQVRIARLPANVREAVASVRRSHAAARVLVILGDDTGLDFEAELDAITSLSRLSEIKVIGWQPGLDTTALKQTICDTIQADSRLGYAVVLWP